MKPFDKIALARKVQGLTIVQKSLLNAIASHLGNNDFAYLSITTLQEDCCIAKRNSVVDGISALVKLGLLTKKEPTPQCKSNQYGINFEQICCNLGLPVTESTYSEVVTQGYQTSNPRLPVTNSNPHSLVTDGYQTSNLGLPPQLPTVTTLVTQGYPKEHINNQEKKLERQPAPASRSPLSLSDIPTPKPKQNPVVISHSSFLPNEEAKFLAKDLKVDLETEWRSFIDIGEKFSNRYANKDLAFLSWIKKAKEYQSKLEKRVPNGLNGKTENTTYGGIRDFTQERLDREDAERRLNELH